MHTEHLAQPPHRELVLKFSNEGVPYPDVLAKYTAAFFKMSHSSVNALQLGLQTPQFLGLGIHRFAFLSGAT